MIQGIHQRSPKARVFVVNYAAILPDEGPGCWPQMPVTDGDVPYVRAKQKELNAMMATEAAANGAALIDWYTASIGHDACKPPVIRWVEPVVPVNAAAPLHPNLGGMIGASELLTAALSSRPRAAHLVDRREAGLEAAARGPQVEPPDARSARRRRAGSPRRGCRRRARPVAERLGVVVAEVLHVVRLEPGALERELDAREVQRGAVGEHVALRERAAPPGRRRAGARSRGSARGRRASRAAPAGARTRRSELAPTCSTMPMLATASKGSSASSR